MTDEDNDSTEPKTETLSDGEFFDQFADMMYPSEIVRMLDRRCWATTVLGIYQVLDKRFRDDPEAQKKLKSRDLSEVDPGYGEFILTADGGAIASGEDDLPNNLRDEAIQHVTNAVCKLAKGPQPTKP